jgi:hypothetical protein
MRIFGTDVPWAFDLAMVCELWKGWSRDWHLYVRIKVYGHNGRSDITLPQIHSARKARPHLSTYSPTTVHIPFCRLLSLHYLRPVCVLLPTTNLLYLETGKPTNRELGIDDFTPASVLQEPTDIAYCQSSVTNKCAYSDHVWAGHPAIAAHST